MKWVHCSPPGDIQRKNGEEEDETVTFSHFLHRYRLWKQRKKRDNLLGQEGADYGGIHTEMTLEKAPSEFAEVSMEKSTDGV